MGLLLCKDGRTAYAIALADDAVPAERTAAAELQKYLLAVTGTEFPIVKESMVAISTRGGADDGQLDVCGIDVGTRNGVPAGAKSIAVGYGELYRRAFPEPELLPEDDTIAIRTAGDTLFIAGSRPRGTLYAVYEFLERFAGIRWWTPRDIAWSPIPTLSVEPMSVVYTPEIKIREVMARQIRLAQEELDGMGKDNDGGIVLEESQFPAILRCNGFFMNVADRFGGGHHMLGGAHTFEQIVPPGDYYAEHPEWYAEIGGVRDTRQLCLSNTEMGNRFTANLLGWLREHAGTKYVSVSQNDYPVYCECADCREKIARLGSPTDYLLSFVNEAADAVASEFPDVIVETLAYQWTRKPPASVKPRPSVMIRLCSIECSQNHPLDHELNRHFYNDLLDWAAVTSNLYVWNYTFNAHNLAIPHFYVDGTAHNLRLQTALGVRGIFQQGDGYNMAGNFRELSTWVNAKLLWDPGQNEEALIETFLAGYYGKASGPIRSLRRLVQDRIKASGEYYGCFFRGLAGYYDSYRKVLPQITTASWLRLEDLNAAEAMLSEAEALAADNARLARRVEACRIPFEALWLQDYDSLRLLADREGKPFGGPTLPTRLAVDRFAEKAKLHYADYHAEGWPFTQGYTEHLISRLIRVSESAEGTVIKVPGRLLTQTSSSRTHHREAVTMLGLEADAGDSGGVAAVLEVDRVRDDRLLAFVHNLSSFYYYAAGGRWEIQATARCEGRADQAKADEGTLDEGTADQGPAFRVRLYDVRRDTIVAEVPGTIGETEDGRYRTYSLGRHELTDGLVLRIDVADRGRVGKLYLDGLRLTERGD